ncbi:MAG: thioredoxin family protein [Erysipelotrichaceae bacterium]|nr:thioredoxin family protein [Erysipelotrichaceae bacterium]
MKQVKLFYLRMCPYCLKALKYLEELKKEERYKDIEIEMIEENKHPEIANQYNYYYVPTFYVDEVKVFEGKPTLEDIKRVLDQSL